MGAPARPVFRNPAAATIDAPTTRVMRALFGCSALLQPAAAWLLQAFGVLAAAACGPAMLTLLPAAIQVLDKLAMKLRCLLQLHLCLRKSH